MTFEWNNKCFKEVQVQQSVIYWRLEYEIHIFTIIWIQFGNKCLEEYILSQINLG